jgi:hypothetical protein
MNPIKLYFPFKFIHNFPVRRDIYNTTKGDLISTLPVEDKPECPCIIPTESEAYCCDVVPTKPTEAVKKWVARNN